MSAIRTIIIVTTIIIIGLVLARSMYSVTVDTPEVSSLDGVGCHRTTEH
jgi:hypothetical protein